MNRTHLDPVSARLAANTLRMLAVDAVEQARSGHPGLPMGAADFAFVLWYRHLRFNPKDPEWPGRDRFVLSAGHGSALLYGLLHLFGYDLPLEDLRRFRQWGSRTPGHPEFGHTPGVEVTTGPLGQGIANAVGMALASRMAGDRCGDGMFDPAGCRVFALVSDGDLMEGISHEAASLAGHLRLDNLVCLYDDNRITIEGSTGLAVSDDVKTRFNAYGWRVEEVDGHDAPAVDAALEGMLAKPDRPSLLVCRTHIGWGSPGRQDTAEVHGSPLGAAEARATRQNLGWPDEEFHIPELVREICATRLSELEVSYDRWKQEFREWQRRSPDKSALWSLIRERTVPDGVADVLAAELGGMDGATRTLAGAALNIAASLVPALAGGSADLAPSTATVIKDSTSVEPGSYSGRNIHFGIREHAMGAIMNGMARFGGVIPFGSTFLVFSDYCRPAIRLSALMGLQVVYVFTHDSIFVGEDGPTHQPVEQTASLRLIPGLTVIRPADGNETALSWAMALERRDGPTALILTRQKLPPIPRSTSLSMSDFRSGGYQVREGGERPDVVIMASGSEVSLAVAAAKLLEKRGVSARILSVPCLGLFICQPRAARERLIPAGIPRVAVEAGQRGEWARLLAEADLFIGVETFGASAPEHSLAAHFGLNPEMLADSVAHFLQRRKD